MIKLSAFNNSLIEVRLIEGRDEAYINVNEHYFSLETGIKLNISSALQEGVNLLNFKVKTYSLPERIIRGLVSKDWCGRFELYIDGKLAGTYRKNGGVFMGSCEYTVAEIELNININPPGPTQEELLRQIINRLQQIPGMTPANPTDVQYSTPYLILKSNIKIHTWKNLAGVDHVFLIDPLERCRFAGYVGWIHAQKFYQTLQKI
ncbi:MAG: hypothetical protein ACKPH7_09100 [Planktothrix sp.]